MSAITGGVPHRLSLPERPAQPPPVRFAPAPAATEAAVGWRLGAALLDDLIIIGAYLAACLLLWWRPLSPGHLWLLAPAAVAYHLGFEACGGQTFGKYRCRVRVVALDDSRASLRAIAIRSAFRIVDWLPLFYAAGLVTMTASGAARRQRIGDRLAGTKVIDVGPSAGRLISGQRLLAGSATVAILASGLTSSGLVAAGSSAADRPTLSPSAQATFITNCEQGAGWSAAGCRCLLTQLTGAGYDTPESLAAVVGDGQGEAVSGHSGTARSQLARATGACLGSSTGA